MHFDDDKTNGKKANQIDCNNNQIDKNSITVQLSTETKNKKTDHLTSTDHKADQQEANILDYSFVGDRAVIFSLDNQVGGLVRALRIFQVSKY